MSKDYKSMDRKLRHRDNGGSMFIGILIGLVLGLAIALGVAWYINKMPSPFQQRDKNAKTDVTKATEKNGKDADGKSANDKSRFDFYKMLPGSEEQAVDLPSRDTKSTAKEFFYLQVGSFQNAPEADNLKAQVALIGLQATIQTISSAERGVLHRVRLGPFGNVDDVNRNREILKKNGIEATLIKGRDSDK